MDVRSIGDEGGFLCELDFGHRGTKAATFVSITHLTFDRKDPLWREIEDCKKHRIKRLRKLQGRII